MNIALKKLQQYDIDVEAFLQPLEIPIEEKQQAVVLLKLSGLTHASLLVGYEESDFIELGISVAASSQILRALQIYVINPEMAQSEWRKYVYSEIARSSFLSLIFKTILKNADKTILRSTEIALLQLEIRGSYEVVKSLGKLAHKEIIKEGTIMGTKAGTNLVIASGARVAIKAGGSWFLLLADAAQLGTEVVCRKLEADPLIIQVVPRTVGFTLSVSIGATIGGLSAGPVGALIGGGTAGAVWGVCEIIGTAVSSFVEKKKSSSVQQYFEKEISKVSKNLSFPLMSPKQEKQQQEAIEEGNQTNTDKSHQETIQNDNHANSDHTPGTHP